jgi:hypothetical protein
MFAHGHCRDRAGAGGDVIGPAFRALALLALVAAAVSSAAAQEPKRCGELVTLAGHGNAKLSYSFATPEKATAVLILLPGGSGFADLDQSGCARKLMGNSLVRTRDLFHAQGFATALVDAPSNYRGEDGLGGFRISPRHAEDLGKIIADIRQRTKLPVWVIGTSRGTISAVNAASRLTGEQAPDGVVLTSPLTAGRVGGRKEWVAHTVFSLDLATINIPVLVVANAADACIRTPPSLAASILSRTNGSREQAVMVRGAIPNAAPNVDACEGRTPHGFIGHEQEVTDGIVRFIKGGSY